MAESKLWQNTSVALAHAEQQDWLNQHLAQAGAARYTVIVGESDTDTESSPDKEKTKAPLADLTQVRARIEFNTDPQALQTLLASFLRSEHRIIVESLLVKAQRTTLTVTAWYKLPSPVSATRNKKT
jgi:hypothetical protein